MKRLQGRLWLLMIAMLCLVLGGTATLAKEQKPADARCSKAEEFKEVPGIGPSCRMPNGTWKIRLKDGFIVESHGPDTAAEAELTSSDVSVAAASTHACATDYYGHLIYAYASDRPNNYATAVTTIRSWFQGSQDLLNQEFAEFGQSGSYKMLCNTDGSLKIDSVRLATAFGSTSFSTVQSDLRAQGYSNSRAKYWIYFDGKPPSAGYCGIAGLRSDDRATVDNGNNIGPSYAMSVACNAFMHENGHNLGAVQGSAPNTSGAGHCIDGQDVMCYSDGGSRPYNPNVCSTRHYDCNHNDYFHPNPPAGSYLATHWNIGACYVRYIQRSGCGGTIPPTATRTRTNTSGTGPTPTRTSTPSAAINRALNKAATGSSPCASSETPPKAVDGATANNSKFCSLVASKWLRVDLGASFSLTRFVVKHAGAGGESTAWNTSAFNIQTSPDGTTWTTVVTVSGNTASTTSHTIAARSARYVRLNITTGAQSGQANTARIYELEVY